MAVYRMSHSMVKRSTGRSACAAAAYRAGCTIEDERTGQTHDYTRKRGIEHSEIMAPDDAPEWAHDRERLWNAVEAAERRKDAQLAREVLLSLPHELDAEQRRELVREYVRAEYVEKKRLVADIAIHKADRQSDERNDHAHVLLTLRKMEADGLAKKKERTFNDREALKEERQRWAEVQNKALERAGIETRVDHRSLAAQEIDREPEPKLGPVATKMEKQGRRSLAGDDLRAVRERNAERARLAEDRKVIDLAIERERRKLEQQFREARVRDGYAKGVARDHANDDRQREPVPLEPDKATTADGYAQGDPKPLQRDQAADMRQAREDALRERVTSLESQLDGRGKGSILWNKITGRIAWDAEKQLEAQRAELAVMEQARQAEARQLQQDAQRERNATQERQRTGMEADRAKPPERIRPEPQAPPPPVRSRVSVAQTPEPVQTPQSVPPERQHAERLTIAASDAFHDARRGRTVAPSEIGAEAEADSTAAEEAAKQAKLEQYREMFRQARENSRDGPEWER